MRYGPLPIRRIFAMLLCLAGVASGVADELLPDRPERIIPTGYLLLPRVGDYTRGPLHTDPVEAALARGEWTPPVLGNTVRSAAGPLLAWQAESNPPASVTLRGGYAYATFMAPAEEVMLLEAGGIAAVCLNGEWIAGDPYDRAAPRVPVQVLAGENQLLLHLVRPDARATFVRLDEPVHFDTSSTTLPDLLHDLPEDFVGSVPLVNGSDTPLAGLEIVAQVGEGKSVVTPLPRVAARSVLRASFRAAWEGSSSPSQPKLTLTVRKVVKSEETHRTEVVLPLRLVPPEAPRRQTFVSHLDGSVQPYVVRLADLAEVRDGMLPSVVVVLHDAGQTCEEVLARHRPVPGCHTVAPHGRGDFGFDWEDWSATDVLETLANFEAHHPMDPTRIALTGEGLGGHGALWISGLHPDRFALVGSDDGRFCLASQADTRSADPRLRALASLLNRPASAADPLLMATNLTGSAVRFRYSAAGRGATLAAARRMRQLLGEFHPDFAYREVEPRAEPSPLFTQLPSERPVPPNPNRVEFTTPDPALLAERAWVSIEAVRQQGALARVVLEREVGDATFTGTTDNVRVLRLSLEGIEERKRILVRLDGQRTVYLPWPSRSMSVRVERDSEGDWGLPTKPDHPFARRATKSRQRAGGLKSVFGNRPILVYGTRGDDQENRWAESKARYDAALFRYRGGGLLEVVADHEFDPRAERDRNIVLYGNHETNAACRLLLFQSVVTVQGGQVDVGPRPEVGNDLGVLLVAPRPGSQTASVALIGGTGLVGMRATTRLRYFWSGVHYPDLLIFGAGVLDPSEGETALDEVRAAGWFGPNWDLTTSEIRWRDLAL